MSFQKNMPLNMRGRYDEDSHIVRFCTSWANTEAEVDELVGDIERL